MLCYILLHSRLIRESAQAIVLLTGMTIICASHRCRQVVDSHSQNRIVCMCVITSSLSIYDISIGHYQLISLGGGRAAASS